MRLGGRRGKPSLAPTRESETDIGRGPGEAPWGPRVGAGRGTESAAFLFERGARLAGGAYEPSSVRRRGCENRADPHVVVASRAAGMGPCVEETEAAFTRSRPNQRRRGARGRGAEEGEGRRRAHAATVPAVPTWPRATARSRASPRPRGGQNAQVESRPLRGPAQASGRGGACGASRARAQCPRRRSRGRVREALGGCARFLGSTSPPAQFFAALGPPLPPPLPPCHPPSARCEGRAGARRTSTRAYAGACAGGRTRDVSHAAARDHAHSLKLAPPPALRACPGSLRARRKLAHLHAARPGDEIVAIRQRAGRGPGGGRAPSEPRVRASPGARTPPSQASAAMQSARGSTAQIERLATNLPLSNSPRASLSLGKPQRPRT